METSVPPQLVEVLERHKYHFIGQHSAVKRCRWLHETLVNDRPCYKQKFYGIKTHQCIQMTPAVYSCTQQCIFCWRAQSGDIQLQWNETDMQSKDSPEEIVEKCIETQSRILSGYKANPKTNRKKLHEARTPRHVAISLAGEPTLYTRLGELIKTFHKRGFTTFLVSNGTIPSALANLGEEPTQLYISVCGSDEETYKKVCRPHTPQAWKRLSETLALLPSFKCPTVIRITSVQNANMTNEKGYAQLIEKARPTYVEAKAYMHVGFSRLRLEFGSTPSHSEIVAFSERLAQETGYRIINDSKESRVVLLSRIQAAKRFGDG